MKLSLSFTWGTLNKALFPGQGHFASHIRRMRELYRKQRDALVAALRRRFGYASCRSCGRRLHDHVEAPAQSALMLGFGGYPHQTLRRRLRLIQAER
jgi:GntR family transcriptional regulator/MocR family aminotransferase